MVKVYTAKFKAVPMDIRKNFEAAQGELSKALAAKCEIIVFPQGFLLGAPLGILEDAAYIKELYNDCVDKLCGGIWLSRIRILCDRLTDNGFESLFSYQGHTVPNEAFKLDKIGVLAYCDKGEFLGDIKRLRDKGDLFILNWSKPTVAGELFLLNKLLTAVSCAQGVHFVLCLGGNGYSTHPHFYTPCVGAITKGGGGLFYDYRGFQGAGSIYEVEVTRSLFVAKCPPISADFAVDFSQNPLVPRDVDERAYCLELFDMQSAALAGRMENIGCKNLVLNLSGGLDSTLALLVCVNAFDMLSLDRGGLHILTLPGFGTGSITKNLAAELCKKLELPLESMDINAPCTQALFDLHHDGLTADIAYENIQARMRTLYALTLANMCNGLMVGTGDLSEEALGFSTYGGDQMASYNVNCCISKTVMRTMLPYITELDMFKSVSTAVADVLAIPISPELIPSDGGEICQRTEEVLAPYKLIDFYIYCFVGAKLSPMETLEKAQQVFDGEFSPNYLKEKLQMFYTRFAHSQFKRSCCPEGAAITHINLLGAKNFYPSDGAAALLTDFLNN
ncbi:MAG: NAD(+) synthase [Oscillospiraceae bacterium]